MKKSQLEYMCFCLFVIVVCISIIGFTSCSDLKMKLVSEDLDTYFVEHAGGGSTRTAAEQKLIDERKNKLKSNQTVLQNLQTEIDSEKVISVRYIEQTATLKEQARKAAGKKSHPEAMRTYEDAKKNRVAAKNRVDVLQKQYTALKETIDKEKRKDENDDKDESAKKDKKDKKGKHPGGGSKYKYYKSNCNDKQEREKTFKKLIASGCLKSTTNPGAGLGQMFGSNDSKVDVKGQCKDRVFNMTWASPTPDYKDIHGID